MEDRLSKQEYVRKLLAAYCRTPGTTGMIRRSDRLLAAQLYQRGVPLTTIQNALVLVAARRLLRGPGSPPLGTVRSLAYFLPTIDELLNLRVSEDYLQYLRQKIQPFIKPPQAR